MDTNIVILIGRMTKEIETRKVGEHTAGSFALAVNSFKKDEVSFIDCKCWNKQTEILSQYSTKGSRLSIVGQLKQESWESEGKKHSKIVVNVKEFQFLDSKKESNETLGEPRTDVKNSFSGKDVPITENAWEDEIPY